MRNLLAKWNYWRKSLPSPLGVLGVWVSYQILLTAFGLLLLLLQAVIPRDPFQCSADYGILGSLGIIVILFAGLPTSALLYKLDNFYQLVESPIMQSILPVIILFGPLLFNILILFALICIFKAARKKTS